MEKWYVIGIDIGTQGTKTALFDSEGNKITEAFEASHLIYCRVGEVYQKPLGNLWFCFANNPGCSGKKSCLPK